MVEVSYTAEYNVFSIDTQHSEQPESINNTCVVEKVDSNVIPDLPDICDNDIQSDQNAEACDNERVALTNLIVNLKLDVDENKKTQKQLKKANTSLAYELKECKSILTETSRTLGDGNKSIQTIHMLAPKDSTFNGRPTFANPMYLKKTQSEKPYMYEIPYDTSDLANKFTPDRKETLTLKSESRSKLNKDLVKPYDYTK
ncbi:hypothetical protein Tco_0371204 [Tanacetum coccineum]